MMRLITIKIFPLQEKYIPSQPTEFPNIDKIMRSEKISSITIEFYVSSLFELESGEGYLRIPLKSYIDRSKSDFSPKDEEKLFEKISNMRIGRAINKNRKKSQINKSF